MRVVGLDGGTKRIGVALSDELGITAQPLTTLQNKKDRDVIDDLRVALGDVQPDAFVIGLPLRLDGSEGGAARKARSLARAVEEAFQVPVELWDERFTSVQAERMLIESGLRRDKRKGVTDRVAAAILLQSYLDANSSRPRLDEP
jgi:putative holliday junction resolvase